MYLLDGTLLRLQAWGALLQYLWLLPVFCVVVERITCRRDQKRTDRVVFMGLRSRNLIPIHCKSYPWGSRELSSPNGTFSNALEKSEVRK